MLACLLAYFLASFYIDAASYENVCVTVQESTEKAQFTNPFSCLDLFLQCSCFFFFGYKQQETFSSKVLKRKFLVLYGDEL